MERRTIFLDDDDRRDFLRRLDRILPESAMPCLAWVLIPNHVHLLVGTVSISISRVMARVGTGYARRFNQRHGRVGHLFQNRFRSRPIFDEADLHGVLRYVHLNPVKHGLVGPDGLEAYPWSGHRALLGVEPPRSFHDVASALAGFDPADPGRAREALRGELREAAVALASGSEATPPTTAPRNPPPAPSIPASHGDALGGLLADVAHSLAVGRREIASGSHAKPVVRARAVVCYRAHVELGIPVAHLMAALGVSEASVRRAIEAERRRRIAAGLSPFARSAGPSPQ